MSPKLEATRTAAQQKNIPREVGSGSMAGVLSGMQDTTRVGHVKVPGTKGQGPALQMPVGMAAYHLPPAAWVSGSSSWSQLPADADLAGWL